MELDLSAFGRALEYLAVVSNSLVTLHASFVLGFIGGVAGLRRYRRGSWDDVAYVSFLAGLSGVLLLFIVFVGLRLEIAVWPLLFLGAAAAALAWATSGALPLPIRRTAARFGSFGQRFLSAAAFRLWHPRIPDQLPRELRSFDARHR
jgi:hypothetical protein